jgi:hypothetical protein
MKVTINRAKIHRLMNKVFCSVMVAMAIVSFSSCDKDDIYYESLVGSIWQGTGVIGETITLEFISQNEVKWNKMIRTYNLSKNKVEILKEGTYDAITLEIQGKKLITEQIGVKIVLSLVQEPSGSGSGEPNESKIFDIEKATILYNVYESTFWGGSIPDSYDNNKKYNDVIILTFDNYGKRARMDANNSWGLRIWDTTTNPAKNYENGKWTDLNPNSLYGSINDGNQKYYQPYISTGVAMGAFYIDSYPIPENEINRISTTTKNIAGKTCTVYTYRYSKEPEACYWRFGYWNGIMLLAEGTYVYNSSSKYFIVLTPVAQKVVTDIPSNAFDPKTDVKSWILSK